MRRSPANWDKQETKSRGCGPCGRRVKAQNRAAVIAAPGFGAGSFGSALRRARVENRTPEESRENTNVLHFGRWCHHWKVTILPFLERIKQQLSQFSH